MSDKSHTGILIRVGILWAALQVTVCKIRARWLTGLMERLGKGCISYDIVLMLFWGLVFARGGHRSQRDLNL